MQYSSHSSFNACEGLSTDLLHLGALQIARNVAFLHEALNVDGQASAIS